MSECRIDGCAKAAKSQAKGICGMHIERIRKHGSPDVVLVIHDSPTRLLNYVTKTDTCWLWTGTLTWDGYGLFRHEGRRSGAHRFAYEFFVGPIPAGMQIDHLCRVRNCVRPDHLEPVTPGENTRRGAAALGSHCKNGHEYTFDRHGHRICGECRNESRRRRKAEARGSA